METLSKNRGVFRFKNRSLLSLLIIFALTACGTVNVNYDSTIRAPDDFSISLEIRATDMFAEMLREEGSSEDDIFDLNDYEGWEVSIIEDQADSYGIQVSQEFRGATAQKFLEENSKMLTIDETTFDDVIEYRIEVPLVTDFASDMDLGNENSSDSTNDLFGDGFDESMMAMMDHMVTMDATIRVFGDVIESNSASTIAPSENGTNMHQLRWHYSLSDLSKAKENPLAITTVEVKKGIFGSCNNF